MSKLYCISYKWASDGEERWVAARRSQRESAYVHGAAYIQYASVHADKSKMERKLKSLKKEFPDELADAFVRALTEKEVKQYEEEMAKDKQHRDYVSRKANWSLTLSEDGGSVSFCTKKGLNNADRAALEIFQSLGIKLQKTKYGLTYFWLKRPDQSKRRGD